MATHPLNDHFTYGGAKYVLAVPAINQRTPRPQPRTRRQWVEIPYGGNKNENGIGRGPTVWTPSQGIVVPDAASYGVFEELYDRFAILFTPWHAQGVNAVLTQLELTPYDDLTWRGSVTFEWA